MERAAEGTVARKDGGPPGLATGWTLGPDPSDARVRQRSGGHRLDTHVHVLIVGDDSDRIAVPLTRDLAWAFPNLCFDRVDAPGDLPGYQAGLGADDRVVLGVATSEVADIDALILSLRAIAANSEDAAAIDAAAHALSQGTEAFAAARMNAGIQKALAGQSLDSI